MSVFDIPAEVSVQAFNIDVYRVEGSPSSTQAVIKYRGFGPLSSSNTLTSWEYSLDSGNSWETITLAEPSEVNNVGFSPSGQLNSLTWNAYGDLGSSLFNTDIYIRLSATDGNHNTPKEIHSFTIEKALKPNKALGTIKNDFARGVPASSILPELFRTPSSN